MSETQTLSPKQEQKVEAMEASNPKSKEQPPSASLPIKEPKKEAQQSQQQSQPKFEVISAKEQQQPPHKKKKKREVEALKRSTPTVTSERQSLPPTRWSSEMSRRVFEETERKKRKRERALQALSYGDSEDPHRPTQCSYCKEKGTLKRNGMKPQGDDGKVVLLRYDCDKCNRTQWTLVSAADIQKDFFEEEQEHKTDDDDDDSSLTSLSESENEKESDFTTTEDEEEQEKRKRKSSKLSESQQQQISISTINSPSQNRKAKSTTATTSTPTTTSPTPETSSVGKKTVGSKRMEDSHRPKFCQVCKGIDTFRRNGSNKFKSGKRQLYRCKNCSNTLYNVIYESGKVSELFSYETNESVEKQSTSTPLAIPSTTTNSSPSQKPHKQERKSSKLEEIETKQKKKETSEPSISINEMEVSKEAKLLKIRASGVEELSKLLSEAGIPIEIITLFKTEQIDGTALSEMSESDFQKLGVKFGPQVKIRTFLGK